MSKVVQNIGTEAIQKHTILFGDSEIILTLRFLPRQTMWIMDVVYGEHYAYGVKLTVGVPHLFSMNFPFDFIVRDLSGNGIDPFKRTDFNDGRCELYFLESSDMESIRGVEVPE